LSVKNPEYPVIIEISMIIAKKVDVICIAFVDIMRIPECFSIYGVPLKENSNYVANDID
jgi:hypothetical protein